MLTRIIHRIAEEVLGSEKAKHVWGRLELIGDIAVIKRSPEIDLEDLKLVAKALITRLPYVKSVWAAWSPVEGEYRLRSFVHLAGEYRSETIYREHGCRFKVDIRRVFVTPRLSYEHIRVAKLVRGGEVVVNMYAGVGFFSILIAKYSGAERIYSIDINPVAYHYMVENILLNKVDDRVVPILGDAVQVIERMLQGKASRVLMPLPDLALEHLPYAIKALKGDGIIHVYLHVGVGPSEDPLTTAENILYDKLRALGLKGEFLASRVVRMVGPRRYQVVVDLRVHG